MYSRMVEFQEDRLAWPEGWPQRLLFIFGLPFLVALSLTIPDCSRPKYEKYYIITFVMSISWISIISSYMVSKNADGQVLRLSHVRHSYARVSSVHRTGKTSVTSFTTVRFMESDAQPIQPVGEEAKAPRARLPLPIL